MIDQGMTDNQRKEMAKALNIEVYSRYDEEEASTVLNVTQSTLSNIINNGAISFVQVSSDQIEFFGFQLLEYLLDSIVERTVPTTFTKNNEDRILRFPEVREMTGLSRTTLWRMENDNKFPKRVPLGVSSIGWKLSEVQNWIKLKNRE